tara:strand:+ start:116 stop:1090 length:975 start_codon:yes stop_codon:yes gene_type:complete
MRILITGCSGFIGYHVANRLLKNKKNSIFGIDNLNSYYDVKLKKKRLSDLKKHNNFKFDKIDIANNHNIKLNFLKNKYNLVIHLAAQAGVRNSIQYPEQYFESNIKGFFNVLESCKKLKVKHLIFASTSSVYGDSKKFPLKENANTDKPLSFYAASKKSNEVMAYSYSYIYKLPITGLRFFTVYGPMGRPDMSLFKFVKNILENKKISLFNKGNHIRDFTYVDDVVNYIEKIIYIIPKNKIAPFEIYNIASNKPKALKSFISLIEKNLLIKSKKIYKGLQKGDVHKTHGDNKKIVQLTKVKTITNIEKGIKKFIDWYRSYEIKK